MTMRGTIPINDADMAMLRAYATDVTGACMPLFTANADRFTGATHLLARFEKAMGAVYQHGRGQFHAAHEAHNELCAAIALLAEPTVTSIAYEPPLSGTKQTIDFAVIHASGLTGYIDVKTIRPKRVDKWQQFERVRSTGRIADNTVVILLQRWLGGELWHDMYASRDRMLEYTVEFERKIRAAGLAGSHTTLMFCGEGGSWYIDQLEDFAAFYRSGEHVLSDALSKMEAWDIEQKEIVFDGSVRAFATMRRNEFELCAERFHWNVGDAVFDGS